MADLSIFKIDSQTINIKDTTAREAADSAKTLATTASGNATTALNKINELESEKADAIISSASGAIASFQDGAEAPVKSLTVGIKPVQEGTGDPSPDNVRPISGWTGCVISHSGADTSNPTTYPITFPSEAGTVYGGSLDVTTGVLTVDRVMKTVTASETGFLFVTGTNANRVAVTAPNSKLTPAEARTSVISNIAVADAIKPLTASLYEVGYFCIYSGGSDIESQAIFCVPSDCTTSTSAVRWLADNGCVFVYALATPITYTLTPQEITSLLGQNNVWADTGDMSVTYRADTKLYIDKKFTELQALILEN